MALVLFLFAHADYRVDGPAPIHAPIPALPHILVNICTAESGFHQFNDDGTVLRGRVNPHDIGLCQINEEIWGKQAALMGYNIYTEAGNRLMALWLYGKYGTQPWLWSRPIWGHML